MLLLLSFSRSAMTDSLQPRGLQHARLPCLSPSPGVCSNSCPLSWWCHLTVSSSYSILLLPSIFSSLKFFTNEPDICIMWPKYWSLSFSISPSSEYSRLVSFQIDWFDLLVLPRDSQNWSPAPQSKSIDFSMLSLLCGRTDITCLTSRGDYMKNQFVYRDLCWQRDSLAFQYTM